MSSIGIFFKFFMKTKKTKSFLLFLLFAFAPLPAFSESQLSFTGFNNKFQKHNNLRKNSLKFRTRKIGNLFISNSSISNVNESNDMDIKNNKNINSKTEIKKSGDLDNNFDFQKTQWSREKAKKVQEEITKWKSYVADIDLENDPEINKPDKINVQNGSQNSENVTTDEHLKSENNKKIDNTPPLGKISVGEFFIQPRGFIDLEGPPITLNFVDTSALEAIKFLAKYGNYGFVYVDNKNTNSQEKEEAVPKITANFTDKDYSMVLNSLLMASDLQAKFEKGIIFVGANIFNKSLQPKISKTYRINQASAASVGDYLSTLGAKISKVLVKSSAIAGDELGNGLKSSIDLTENYINSYGVEGGPLSGLIGTVDLRLQTITLVGNQRLISTAENYIKSLDVRHRQVSLSVKIIDVSLTKSDLTNNRFEAKTGSTYIINNGGFDLTTGNDSTWAKPNTGGPVSSIATSGALANNTFFNWLSRKISNDNAKIIASPTLILGENQEPIVSGAAAVDDSLGSATIGRPFANEAFIKVGENVITSFETTTTDGVTTCSANNGTAGITFGAKLNKVDDNGYITFSLSPAISSVTKTESVANCGTQSTLSVRKLDTGIIRVKNGNTLVLTGVLKDEDTINTTKTPLIGDLPILGRLFRNNTTLKRKSELIILVTPEIIND